MFRNAYCVVRNALAKNSRWRIGVAAGLVGIAAMMGGIAYASSLEQDNNFCASCHTQPETEYLARFNDAVAKKNALDLAAFHHRKKEVKCIDCHVGEGIVGRGAVLSVSAWDALKHFTGTATQPAARMIFPLQNEGCAKCHEKELAKRGFENHMHNKMPDADAPFVRCTDCHVSHRKGDERNVFQFRDAILPQCEYCHVQMDRGPRGLSR